MLVELAAGFAEEGSHSWHPVGLRIQVVVATGQVSGNYSSEEVAPRNRRSGGYCCCCCDGFPFQVADGSPSDSSYSGEVPVASVVGDPSGEAVAVNSEA